VEARVARAGADPARCPAAALPGGWPGLAYLRLHGSPRMYYSAYEGEWLERLAVELRGHPEAWCIFDNTAGRAAVPNALHLLNAIEDGKNEKKEPALRPRLSRGAR
jgi:uncharacterized protein YecE (DUF72 family)